MILYLAGLESEARSLGLPHKLLLEHLLFTFFYCAGGQAGRVFQSAVERKRAER